MAEIDRYDFAFEPRMARYARPFGVRPDSAWVEVGDGLLRIRFGPWALRTPLANVVAAEPTGPYTFWKVAGPAHLSVRDRGVTFATTTAGGVCITFAEPVAAIVPLRVLRHPAATVTVERPDALVERLRAIS